VFLSPLLAVHESSGRNAAATRRYQEIAAATRRAIVIALLNAPPPPAVPSRVKRAIAYDDHTRGCCDATRVYRFNSSYKCHVSEQDVLNSLSRASRRKREDKGQGQRTRLESEAGL